MKGVELSVADALDGWGTPSERAALLASECVRLRNERDALRDALAELKRFVTGERNDAQNIAEIINGALCFPPNVEVSGGSCAAKRI